MAQRVIIQLEDDIDGTPLSEGEGETVQFGLDGTAYEIDLSNTNAKVLREALAPYLDNGRRLTGKAAKRRGVRGQHTSQHSTREVRDWARSNGHNVPDRGRIPAHITEQFDAAH